MKNVHVARTAWGSEVYDKVPKSVFAAIAWHLANVASGNCDAPGAAERRFLEEWRVLLDMGFEMSKPSKEVALILTNTGKEN